MKKCDNCKYAEWKKTSAGRLHPDKTGKCMYPIKEMIYPESFYFISKPHLSGGSIQRGKDFKEHCKVYEMLKL